MKDDKSHHPDHHDERDVDLSYVQNPDTRHEESDVRIKPVALFIFWLMVATGVIALLMIVLFNSFLDGSGRSNYVTREFFNRAD